MDEHVIHRHNHGIDPVLDAWGWEIPVYLFLGGLVAGLMVIAGMRLLLARPRVRQPMVCWTAGPWIALALLSVGMLALFLDLSHKACVWRLYLTFQVTSPMSWGAWILLAVYPALAANALLHLPVALPALTSRFPVLRRVSDRLLARPRVVLAIALANIVLGVGLGVYTGLLLGTLGARPLWASAVLGPLFLFSGLSTAAALLHAILVLSSPAGERPAFADFLIARLTRWPQATPPAGEETGFAQAPDPARLCSRSPLQPRALRVESEAPELLQADNSFLTVEAALLGTFLLGHTTASAVHRQAADLLLTGPYAAVFWVFVVGLGLLLPLTLQHFELQHRIRHTLAPSLLVLLGGLVLRFVFVQAGQASHWAATALH
ncbi:MAG: NrfD/PsrC family molybdoenzyme membrane anchor subunit [Planctomycetota bacterium]